MLDLDCGGQNNDPSEQPDQSSYLVVYFFLFLLTRSALIVAPVVRFVDEYGGPARESLAARLAGLFVVVREDCRNAWHSKLKG